MLNGLPIVFSETRAEEAFVSLVWSNHAATGVAFYCCIERQKGMLNYWNGLGLWCLTPIFINNISIILWQVYF